MSRIRNWFRWWFSLIVFPLSCQLQHAGDTKTSAWPIWIRGLRRGGGHSGSRFHYYLHSNHELVAVTDQKSKDESSSLSLLVARKKNIITPYVSEWWRRSDQKSDVRRLRSLSLLELSRLVAADRLGTRSGKQNSSLSCAVGLHLTRDLLRASIYHHIATRTASEKHIASPGEEINIIYLIS